MTVAVDLRRRARSLPQTPTFPVPVSATIFKCFTITVHIDKDADGRSVGVWDALWATRA
ncbi:hypothetical protein Hanom_Chr08g00712581 [Helianthus anomalus]